MENKSYAYEVLHIHNVLLEWNLSRSRMHSALNLLNESGLLMLMNNKKLCSLGEMDFNYFQKQVPSK